MGCLITDGRLLPGLAEEATLASPLIDLRSFEGALGYRESSRVSNL